MEDALRLEGLTVRYGGDKRPPVLQGLSLRVAPGEKVALAGLNGSGKTTLLKAVAGLVPHEGGIAVDGLVLSKRTVTGIRERIGFLFNVPEDQLLFPRVLDDVAFGLLRRGLPAHRAAVAAREALEAVGAGAVAHEPVPSLSHGQKQRVALAGALVADPPLLLLDEPSAGLDPPGKRRLARLLRSLPAAILFATHDLDFAADLAGRFVLIEEGRIAREGSDFSRLARHWDS